MIRYLKRFFGIDNNYLKIEVHLCLVRRIGKPHEFMWILKTGNNDVVLRSIRSYATKRHARRMAVEAFRHCRQYADVLSSIVNLRELAGYYHFTVFKNGSVIAESFFSSSPEGAEDELKRVANIFKTMGLK